MPPNELKKITDTIWELPKTYKEGMLVPARIYATEKLIKDMDDGVFNQVTNVARLPGIINHSFCMPDGHWGYGFPIGGVAAFDIDNGTISPGGIGFDINCLHPDTKILTSHGYFRKIKDLPRNLEESFVSMDIESKARKHAKAMMFLEKEADTPIHEITTKTGHKLVLSGDHPVFDGIAFREARYLKEGDRVATYPFEGVEYEQPSPEIILDEDSIISIAGERKKLIKELKDKDLLPLKFDSDKLPILAKLTGFIAGDGWIGAYYSKKRSMEIWSTRIIGSKETIEEIQKDIKQLGFEANYSSTQEYTSILNMQDGSKREISGTSSQLFVNSQSLSVLLHALGVPKGNKSRTPMRIPQWIKKSPKWIKRLYLAGLFGAELTKPLQRKDEPFGFTEPSFSQNKINTLERENLNFMLDLTNLLLEFGVAANKIYRQKGVINSFGEETHKLSLRISSKPENLIRLWGMIGYEYCEQRRILSMKALSYLRYKQAALLKIRNFVDQSKEQLKGGSTMNEILGRADAIGISMPMIKSQMSGLYSSIRVSGNILSFKDFADLNGIENSPFVMDEIEKTTEIPYTGRVYDIGMNDKDHNFIANSVVSHNCGMRLLSTNLTVKDVRPKIKELVDALFRTVPAGVGSSGFVKLDKGKFREAVSTGAEWALENGFAWKEDLERTEENGRMKDADPEKVSKRAIERGVTQVGTLGSGNHYLEIQHASEIFDESDAAAMGIHSRDQIVIMFHCGSRGFGHQIGTDYLKTFLDAMPKYGMKIWDPELACAPFQSQEGQDYYKAMCCGINMSFANRQVIVHRIREAFSKVFRKSAEEMEMHQVYDVSHNTAKIEMHEVNGHKRKVLVHRKGSTRAFGPGREEVPAAYRDIGQPIIIGGSMETGSYLLLGTKKAEMETFGSTCHGSGRTMSRTAAKRQFRGDQLIRDMEKRGIYVRSVSFAGVAEEAGKAYKDINEVIETVHKAGISKKVVALMPMGNVKG